MPEEKSKSVLYHFRTRGTGAEGVHIAGIGNAFEKLGYRVRFVSPTGVDPRQTAGQNPFQQKTKRTLSSRLLAHCPDFFFELLEIAYNFFAWRKVSRSLAAQGCSFIYERHAFFLCATALIAAKRNIPLVIEVNELVGDQRIRKQPLLSFIARWTDKISFRRARLIIVVSPHLKRRIESYGIAGEKILVLPNAVAAEDHAVLHDRRPVREQLGVAEDLVLIGFIGWFVEWHRLDLFLKVFARVHRNLPHTRLVLVGEGKLKEELQRQIAAEKIQDAVIFVNAVPHHDVPQYIAAFDIAVVPHSNDYRSPIKLFEYMAEAKAVVAPRTEPMQMVIRHRENGLLFDPLSEEQLASALEQLAKDAAQRTALGGEARRNVLERYTWLANARHLLSKLPQRA